VGIGLPRLEGEAMAGVGLLCGIVSAYHVEKCGVILAAPEEWTWRFWHGAPAWKARVAEQIVHDMIEHTVLVAEGTPYSEFVPTIAEDSVE